MKKLALTLGFASLVITSLLYGQGLNEVLIEDFNDNSLNWEIYNGTEYQNSSNIKGGKYILTNNSTENSAFFINTIDYNVKKAFTIEAQINFNRTDGSIMFLTNFADWESPFFGLQIENDIATPVYHTGSQYADGGAYEKQIKNPDFKKNGNLINFKVECILVDNGPYNHQEMTFYVNDVKIAHDNNSNLHESMKNFGFLLFGNTEVAIEHIKIYGTSNVKTSSSITQISTTPFGGTASSSSVATIKAGEPIFGKVFMEKPFKETVGSGYNVDMSEVIYIGGEEASKYEWRMAYGSVGEQGSSYEVCMSPSIADLKYPTEAYTLSKKLIELEPGIHDIKLVVVYQLDGISASNTLGEVTFKFDNTSEAGRKKFEEMVVAYRAQSLKNVKMPIAQMNNTTLEQSVKDAIVNAGWSQTPIKVVIMESDWGTITNQYTGAILERSINVAVATKDKDGQCRIFFPTVFQDYVGNGKYSTKTTLGGIMHRLEQDIDCGNVH